MAKKKETYIQELFDRINGSSGPEDALAASSVAQDLLESFVIVSRKVKRNWSSGSLADAVNDLLSLAKVAEGK